MHVYKTRTKFTKEVDFGDEIYATGEDGRIDYGAEKILTEEIAYWRKHPNLHGWMKDLYLKKGGKESSFNGDPLVLTEKDLDEVKVAILTRSLPETMGFFFGQSKGSINPADLEFVEKAKQAIEEGYTVYYDSSW